MRKKTPKAVATFADMNDAMAAESAGREGLLEGRTIPVPSQISAGCGIAWCATDGDAAALERKLVELGLAFEAVSVVDLY